MHIEFWLVDMNARDHLADAVSAQVCCEFSGPPGLLSPCHVSCKWVNRNPAPCCFVPYDVSST
jgi:hypothetical protein